MDQMLRTWLIEQGSWTLAGSFYLGMDVPMVEFAHLSCGLSWWREERLAALNVNLVMRSSVETNRFGGWMDISRDARRHHERGATVTREEKPPESNIEWGPLKYTTCDTMGPYDN